VVVNLRDVQSLDSSFVAGLLVMRRMLAAADRKLVLCELHPHVHELLERLNLHTLFAITDHEQEGVTAV
jgi:anti-anti-sigma factor